MSVPVGQTPGVSVVVVDETDSLGDTARWAALVERVLVAEGVRAPAETNVCFVDVEAMTELNVAHMGGDGPTDVLSFPIDTENLPEATVDGDVRLVGDIVVCPEVAAAQAPGHAGSFEDELALLLVHGSLHLVGHDHATDDERAAMWAAERQHLDAAWGPLTNDPWSERT